MNRDTVVELSQGARLFVSTQREGEHGFRCAIIESHSPDGEIVNCRIISDGFEGVTCLQAQTDAYQYARRLYPNFAEQMKNPPYLIWNGPSVAS
jgi:hypothetical protein